MNESYPQKEREIDKFSLTRWTHPHKDGRWIEMFPLRSAPQRDKPIRESRENPSLIKYPRSPSWTWKSPFFIPLFFTFFIIDKSLFFFPHWKLKWQKPCRGEWGPQWHHQANEFAFFKKKLIFFYFNLSVNLYINILI